MARNMITGIETQKMQEYTQEQIDRAEHMGIAIPADVKEQILNMQIWLAKKRSKDAGKKSGRCSQSVR